MDRVVEAHSEPSADGYRQMRIARRNDELSLIAFPDHPWIVEREALHRERWLQIITRSRDAVHGARWRRAFV